MHRFALQECGRGFGIGELISYPFQRLHQAVGIELLQIAYRLKDGPFRFTCGPVLLSLFGYGHAVVFGRFVSAATLELPIRAHGLLDWLQQSGCLFAALQDEHDAKGLANTRLKAWLPKAVCAYAYATCQRLLICRRKLANLLFWLQF